MVRGMLLSRSIRDELTKASATTQILFTTQGHGRLFLSLGTSSAPPRSILDYGGDAGQFIPDLEGVERLVYEISDVEPVSGVRRVRDPRAEKVDLVMLTHVLEHASEPLQLVRELADVAVEGGWLYVEVPLDRPMVPPAQLRHANERFVQALSTRWRVVAADLLSTPLRVLRREAWTPFTFPKVHEHLNHFSLGSLQAILLAGGWTPEATMTYEVGRGVLRVAALGMLARQRSTMT